MTPLRKMAEFRRSSLRRLDSQLSGRHVNYHYLTPRFGNRAQPPSEVRIDPRPTAAGERLLAACSWAMGVPIVAQATANEQFMLELINKSRAAAGKQPLAMSNYINTAA